MQFVKPTPFKEAVDKLGAKSVIGSKLNSEEWQQVPLALRERAFFSSTIESVRWLQQGKDFLTDFLKGAKEELPDGQIALKVGSRAQFVKELREFAIAQGLGPLDPEDQGTIKDIQSERRLSLIFNTQTQAANDFGYWKQGMDPAVLNEFPAQRFIREQEVTKPRIIHLQNEGVVRLKTDLQFWLGMNSPTIGGFGVPWGPWGFNSGMGVEDVDRTESEQLGLIQPGEKLQPVEKDFNDELGASVRNLGDDMIARLKESFGNQIQIKDGAAWWKGDRKSKAVAVPRAQKPEKVLEEKVAGQFPADLSKLETVRSLGGSTGATLVRDPESGSLYVMKKGNSAAHIREEFAADQIYRALGIPVPEAKLYEGKTPVKLAQFVEGKPLSQVLKSKDAAPVLEKLREGFAADALLGNWDVAGLGFDNILVDAQGTPWRIDNGGALRFRAQGAAKSAADWNAFATELWSMRDAAGNAQTAKLFGELDFYKIAREIESIDAAKVLEAAPAEIRDVLEARLANLKSIASKALEYEQTRFKSDYADNITKHMMGLRKAGAFERMATELSQSHPGDVILRDNNGNAFDFLRTPKAAAKADPSQKFFDDIIAAVKTINAHHDKSDMQYNAQKIAKALGWKNELKKMAGSGTAAERSMASHYLGFLDRIEEAKNDIAKKIEQFTKYDLPTAKQVKNRSVTAELVDYMNANGGNWKVIEDWASGQGGSSKSNESKALKYWFMQNLEGVSAADFYDAPDISYFKKATARYGDEFVKSFEIFNAFVQELLGRIEFAGNDRTARFLRILRTESTSSAVTIKKGSIGLYKRGVNESGSIFAPVFSGARTLTSVPHTRVTGIYFLERSPGSAHTFFLTDSENEVTFISFDLKTKNLGINGDVNLSPGTDFKKWEL